MAAQLICQLDQVEPAAYIIGHVETGSQVFLCETCLTPWMLTMLDERLSPETWAQLRAHFEEKAAPAKQTPSPTTAPPPRRRGRHSPPAEAEGPAAPPEPPPAPPELS